MQQLTGSDAVVNPKAWGLDHPHDLPADVDALRDEWAHFELDPLHLPEVDTLVEARQYASEENCLRVIRRLAAERKLRGYAQQDFYARLMKLLGQAAEVS